MSTRTSYYTAGEKSFCDESLVHYSSFTCFNEHIQSSTSVEQHCPVDHSSVQTSFHMLLEPFISLPRRLFNTEKPLSDMNNSSNSILINMNVLKEINLFHHVSHV